jgi:hypothetical protein
MMMMIMKTILNLLGFIDSSAEDYSNGSRFFGRLSEAVHMIYLLESMVQVSKE